MGGLPYLALKGMCHLINNYKFLEPEWVLSQWSMRPKAEWAIDSEAMRVRGIIVSVKSNSLVKNIENKKIFAS